MSEKERENEREVTDWRNGGGRGKETEEKSS